LKRLRKIKVEIKAQEDGSTGEREGCLKSADGGFGRIFFILDPRGHGTLL